MEKANLKKNMNMNHDICEDVHIHKDISRMYIEFSDNELDEAYSLAKSQGATGAESRADKNAG